MKKKQRHLLELKSATYEFKRSLDQLKSILEITEEKMADVVL